MLLYEMKIGNGRDLRNAKTGIKKGQGSNHT